MRAEPNAPEYACPECGKPTTWELDCPGWGSNPVMVCMGCGNAWLLCCTACDWEHRSPNSRNSALGVAPPWLEEFLAQFQEEPEEEEV